MGMITEFKEFAMRGNVIDLAVGVVIGAGFGKIVSALVAGVIMPPIGLLVGGVNFSELAVTLRAGSEGVEPILLQYGLFLQALVDFMIIAFVIFLVIKAINRLNRKAEAPPAPAEPSEEVKLLTEIRDALKR